MTRRWWPARRARSGRPVDPEAAAWRLTAERVKWLTTSIVLVVLPHLARLPLWVAGAFGVLVIWRLWSLRNGGEALARVPPGSAPQGPGRWILSAVALGLIGAVLASYGTLLGRSPGVATLSLLATVKLLETRTARDAYTACFLGFFLVVTNFLFDQSIPTALYMFVVVVVMVATMQVVAGNACEPSKTRPPVRLKFAATLLLQALPIMLVMFVLFPRLPGPLWGLPKDAHSGVSGLSDRMSPGAISSLGLSNAVAFRVSFEGDAPPGSKQLYWRGPVFWDTDGTTWDSSRPHRRIPEPPEVRVRGEPVDYTVTLEPHQQRWLFALEMTTQVPPRARLTRNMDLLHRRPVHERMRYSVRSYPDYQFVSATRMELRRALALPEAHPRAKALAQKWRKEETGSESARRENPDGREHWDQRLVRRALGHFRTQPFSYTLQPPALDRDPVDEFLFRTRRGFCEHYASAFTVLMRAAGIPARVVTGYQGGEFNPVGNYLIVRQRDAHAWSEVYLEGRGWVRVDPTAAVAPERIELGMDSAIPPTLGSGVLTLEPSATLMAAWRAMRRRIDAINNGWNQWVLGYGSENQQRFLERFGIDSKRLGLLVALLTAAVLALLVGVALWLARRRAPKDPAARAYARFCQKLARAGLARRANEGPADFAARIAAARPEYAAAATRVTELYVRLRYAPPGAEDARTLASLRAAVAAL